MLPNSTTQSTTNPTPQTGVDELARQLQDLPPGDLAAIRAAVAVMQEHHSQAASEVQPAASSAPGNPAEQKVQPIKTIEDLDRVDPVSGYIRKIDLIERREDDEIRNDPALRLEAVTLVEAFAELLTDSAARLAVARGQDSPWEEDTAKEQLLWVFSEFLTSGEWQREDRPGLTQWYQVDRVHAASHFNVSIMMDDSLKIEDEDES